MKLPQRMRLTITEEDVAKANAAGGRQGKRSAYFCPTLQALRRRYPREKHISVGNHFVTLTHPTDNYAVSDPLREAIQAWDTGQPFPPGTYRLDHVEL